MTSAFFVSRLSAPEGEAPPLFDYAFALASRDDDDEHEEEADKDAPVRTQMIGESPGDDLGYDPDQIPTEPIDDDED